MSISFSQAVLPSSWVFLLVRQCCCHHEKVSFRQAVLPSPWVFHLVRQCCRHHESISFCHAVLLSPLECFSLPGSDAATMVSVFVCRPMFLSSWWFSCLQGRHCVAVTMAVFLFARHYCRQYCHHNYNIPVWQAVTNVLSSWQFSR